MVQVSVTIVVLIILLKVYKNFKDVFLTQNTSYFFLYKNYNYTINLVKNKSLFYKPIYSLLKNEFSIFPSLY